MSGGAGPPAALVLVPEGEGAAVLDARVCGVPLLVRTLLALRRAGAARAVVRLPAGGRAAVAGGLLADRRLEGFPVEVRAGSGGQEEDWLLVAPANLVWDPRLGAPGADPEGAPLGRGAAGAAGAGAPGPARGERWALVRGSADIPAAERVLYRSVVKDTDGYVSRRVNRPLSLAVTRRLIGSRVGPDAVTAAVTLVGLAAAGLVLAGGRAATAAGGLLFAANSVLDGVDGELARLRFEESAHGAWLDRVCDKLVLVLFFAAAGWRAVADGAGPGLTAAVAVVLAGFGVGLPLTYLEGYRRRRAAGGILPRPHGSGLRRVLSGFLLEMVFGGVVVGAGKAHAERTPRERVLRGVQVVTKNDLLSWLYAALALAGHLPWLFWVMLPLGAAECVVGAYAVLELGAAAASGLRRG